jgi:hypothetical protein
MARTYPSDWLGWVEVFSSRPSRIVQVWWPIIRSTTKCSLHSVVPVPNCQVPKTNCETTQVVRYYKVPRAWSGLPVVSCGLWK